MKIFYSVKELINFIDKNDELYFNDEYKEYGNKMIEDVISENGNGFYCLDFGSRGEVDFEYVENFVEELNNWNKLEDDDEEFKYMRDDVGSEYLDLNWYEECIRCYFLVVVGGK